MPFPSPMHESKSESEVTQLCPTLSDPMDCSPPGSSVHELSQARILEWVAFLSPRDLPDPGIDPLCPALSGGSLPLRHQGLPFKLSMHLKTISPPGYYSISFSLCIDEVGTCLPPHQAMMSSPLPGPPHLSPASAWPLPSILGL